MAELICICGKICSGKTTLARKMLKEGGAVLLSCDEIADIIFHRDLGERHDAVMRDVQEYLHRKAQDLLAAGCDVILDWGFWKQADRQATRERYGRLEVEQRWHYLDISDAQWQRNIECRNAQVLAGQSADYFVDEGLKDKLLANFEPPQRKEIDFWHEAGEEDRCV